MFWDWNRGAPYEQSLLGGEGQESKPPGPKPPIYHLAEVKSTIENNSPRGNCEDEIKPFFGNKGVFSLQDHSKNSR